MHLLTWDTGDAASHYPISAEVSWLKLDMGDAMKSASTRLRLRRMWRIRKFVSETRPDVVVAFQNGPFLTMALSVLGLGVPVVASERNAPDRFDHLKAGRHRGKIFQTFRLARRVTVQFESYIERYPAYLRSRIVAIPNFVAPAKAVCDPIGNTNRKVLLSVGRLSYQKNIECLIEAFGQIAGRHPDWTLRLVGDGEGEASLRAIAEREGVAERIQFAGVLQDVWKEYESAQAFVLPSRWEGFPNALAEAMAAGLPSVGFSECAGVNELIEDSVSGILASGNGDSGTLAAALDRLLGDEQLRNSLSARASELPRRYSRDAVAARWIEVLTDVTRN